MRWRNWLSYGVLALVSTSLALVFSVLLNFPMTAAASNASMDAYRWDIPAWLPKPIVPPSNPMSVAKVELGRSLFYEPRLSVTGDFACAACHDQALGFTDGKIVSEGATGEFHPRNSMSLTNVAYYSVLTWANPLMRNLETQSLVPLFGEHPIEMGLGGLEQEVITLLQADPDYARMFAAAFPEAENPVTIRHLTQAIASFERILISANSPYDRYRYGGEVNAISAAAKRGEALFNSERLECFHCHSGFNFSDSIAHDRLAFKEIAFHNTGLYSLDAQGSYPPENTGVYEITENPAQMGHFRTPTLRNIALTAPYMHDGSVTTLEEAIAHYAQGGRTVEAGPYAGVGSTSPLKSTFVSGFTLTEGEKADLIAFLESLTDEEFIHNPAFSDPH